MADTPPPGIDLNADQGPRLVGSMIALIVLPTLFVIALLGGTTYLSSLLVLVDPHVEDSGMRIADEGLRLCATSNAYASSSVSA